MKANRHSKRYRTSIIAALIIVTALAYGRTAGHDFVDLDDAEYVRENHHTLSGMTLDGLQWAFTSFHGANWFPLTWLSHMADAQLYGDWAGGHHLTSLLLHIINTVLLYSLLFRTTGGFWRSLFVAALFALHPLHVESVAWISERKDVLSTFFFLLTLLAYARSTRPHSRGWYLAALALFSLGLLSKPMLVTVPCVLLLMDWWPLGRARDGSLHVDGAAPWGRLFLEKVPFFVLSLASSVVTIYAQQQSNAIVSTIDLPLLQRIERAGIHYCWYLAKLLWPVDLSFFYPVTVRPVHWQAVVAAACIAAVSVLVLLRNRKAPYAVVGWFWFLGTLVPVIGLVAVGMQGTADRYTYIPSIGLFIAVTWQARELARRAGIQRTVLASIAAVIILALAILTWRQVAYWENSHVLSEHALLISEDNYVAHTILGNALDDQGRTGEAIDHFRHALRLQPLYESARNSLGVAYCRSGLIAAAMAEFEEAIRLNRNYADAYVNMGSCLAGSGRPGDAVKYFQEALRINPEHFVASAFLERALHEAGTEGQARP